MADEINCKRCGRYEATHDEGDDAPDDIWEPYPMSFKDCQVNGGYTPENPELAAELAEKAKEERRRRQRYNVFN